MSTFQDVRCGHKRCFMEFFLLSDDSAKDCTTTAAVTARWHRNATGRGAQRQAVPEYEMDLKGFGGEG